MGQGTFSPFPKASHMRHLWSGLLAVTMLACDTGTEPGTQPRTQPLTEPGTEPHTNPIVGTYALRTVNGLGFPVILATVEGDESHYARLEILNGIVTVHPDGQFYRNITFR